MIEFERGVYDAVVGHALEGAPHEVCGVLGGERGGDASRISTVERARNASGNPEFDYQIDPEEQFALMESIEAEGREVAGFYHSHPTGPAEPSATDAARATWSGFSYVIVVLGGEHPYVGSWRWNGDEERFDQEVVRIA